MTPAEFKSLMPEFATTDNTVVQRWLTHSETFIDRNRWGKFYSAGVTNFVAHHIVTDPSLSADNAEAAGSGGDVASKSAQGFSLSFSAQRLEAQAADEYQLTRYGRTYARLRRWVGLGMMTTVGGA